MDPILVHLYNACHPLYPASPQQYLDLTAVRGGGTFLRDVVQEIGISRSNPRHDGRFVRKLFTGHSGCGKSTELVHLAAELKSDTPTFPHDRYFPVYIDMLEYVDHNDASLPEILLAVVSELAEHLERDEHIKLRNTYLEDRWQEIKNTLFAEVQLKKTDVTLGSFKTEVNLKLADATTREKVRAHLQPRMTRIIEEVNLVLAEARIALREPRHHRPAYVDLVLILDNMEKIERATGRQMGEDSYRALFIEGASQLTALNAQTLYTVPLSLVRAIGPELANAYRCTPFVLPNVKTEERERDAFRNHVSWHPGRKRLRELLEQRVQCDPDHPYTLAQAFTDGAIEVLLDYCGGHLRQLMRFVQQACIRTQQAPIDEEATFQAVTQSVHEYNSIRPSQWQLLAELEVAPFPTSDNWDNNDPARRQLLEMLCVLEYMNRAPVTDRFNKAMPWYAVHPVIRELNAFKLAVNKELAKSVPTTTPSTTTTPAPPTP